MLTSNDYIDEMNGFAEQFQAAFNTKVSWVSYSGGVPGMECKLPPSRYDDVKQYLIKLLGQPEQVEPWHPCHTKNMPILKFHVTKEMQHLKVSHVNLIHMMQAKHKQYILVTFM